MVTLRRGGQFAVIDDTTAQTEIPEGDVRKALRVLVAAGLDRAKPGGAGCIRGDHSPAYNPPLVCSAVPGGRLQKTEIPFLWSYPCSFLPLLPKPLLLPLLAETCSPP